MRLRFNPPPNWPSVPPDWSPPSGWSPDPGLPPLPPGWQLWVEDPDGPATTAAAPPPDLATTPASAAMPQLKPQPQPAEPRRRLSGLVTFFLIAALVGLVAGVVTTMLTSDEPSGSASPIDLAPSFGPDPQAATTSTSATAVTGVTATATPAASATQPLEDWAVLIRQPVIELLTGSQSFEAAVQARDAARLRAACQAIQQDVAQAQAAGPAPDLGIATAISQALTLYAQAASSCLAGAASLDDGQLTAAARSLTAATTHVTAVSNGLRQKLTQGTGSVASSSR